MLRANDLTFGYKRAAPVLRDVSLELRPGAVTAVLGPNGSGKTTLLRLLLALVKPWSGSINLDEKPLASMNASERAGRIAYVPQRGSVAFPFTVREVVSLGTFATSAPPGRVDETLERLGLADRAGDLFGQLSVGQQQRATLARAIAQMTSPERSTLLADEPVSAMDPRFALDAMGLLRSLASEGVAVGVVLHDFTLASRFADHVLLLDDEGREAANAPVGEALRPDLLERVFATPFAEMSAPDGFRAILPLPARAQ